MVSEEEPGWTVLFRARPGRARGVRLPMFLSPPPPRGRERRLGAPCAPETPLPGSPGGVWVLRAVPGRRCSLPALPGLLYPGRGSGVGRPPQRPGFAGPEAGGSEELGSFTLVACLPRSRRPSSPRWPRAAAVQSRCADPGAPLPSRAQLFLVRRRASGMGGGGSVLKVCADHRGGINWLSLSPDGQRLLTGSEDGTARLWSTADGQCCALLQGRPSHPLLVLFAVAHWPQTADPSSCARTPAPAPADPFLEVQPLSSPGAHWRKSVCLGPPSGY